MLARPLPTSRPLAARPLAAPARRVFVSRALAKGDQFPKLPPLVTDDGVTKVDLNDVLTTTGIALFAYPKANTSGCTVQASNFNAAAAEFAAAGYKVFGLSADAPAQQASWKAQHGFSYPLLCDTDTTAALQPLGWVNADGGIVRSHALVAKGGRVVAVASPVGSKDSIGLALAAVKEA